MHYSESPIQTKFPYGNATVLSWALRHPMKELWLLEVSSKYGDICHQCKPQQLQLFTLDLFQQYHWYKSELMCASG